MKKLLYTFLAVSIIFAACKKEDDTQVAVVAVNGCMDATATNYNSLATNDDGSCTYSIVGIWTPNSVILYSSLTTTINGEIVYELGGQVMTYAGSETMTPEEAEVPENIELTDDGLAIIEDDQDESYYTYSNNVLTISEDGEELMTFACTLTATNLSLTTQESIDTAWFEPGMGDITISAYYGQTIHCTRNTITNTNVSQRVGNSNNSWFVKPKFNNILKSIKKMKK